MFEQVTIKLLHHPPLTATLVRKNLAERSTLPLSLAATWATNTFRSAKAKATPPRRAQMLAMLKPLTIASTQQLTVALCHVYVFSAFIGRFHFY